MNLGDFDATFVWRAFVLLIGVVVAYNAIMQARANHKKAKAETESPLAAVNAHLQRHDEMLHNDKQHLARHDEQIESNGEALRVVLRACLATNSHLLNGNSVDKLRGSNDEIQNYLIKRK